MAKKFAESVKEYKALLKDIETKKFKPIYLLMGAEPYYIDELVDKIIQVSLTQEERDFNQTILYGSDSTAAIVVNAARRYPVFAERQLVVVKEAQMIKKIDDFLSYFENPMPTTILVIAMTESSLDKRKVLYKKAISAGTVFESIRIRDYELPTWIISYVKDAGFNIDQDAALLLAESTGVELRRVSKELDKLFIAIADGKRFIDVNLVEKNVGVSREFSVFELAKAISYRDRAKAFRIAHYLGKDSKKNPMVLIIGGLTSHFLKIIKFHATVMTGITDDARLASVVGTFVSYIIEYKTAARNYPLKKSMDVISLLKEYDTRLKSGSSGTATDDELLMELISFIIA